MKIEIRRGKRGESHKFMSLIGGQLSAGANTIDRLMKLLTEEVKLNFEIDDLKKGKTPK